MMVRGDRIDRVVDGALRHPQVDLEGGRCSARRTGHLYERGGRDPAPVRNLVDRRRRGRGRCDDHRKPGECEDRHQRNESSTRHGPPLSRPIEAGLSASDTLRLLAFVGEVNTDVGVPCESAGAFDLRWFTRNVA